MRKLVTLVIALGVIAGAAGLWLTRPDRLPGTALAGGGGGTLPTPR